MCSTLHMASLVHFFRASKHFLSWLHPGSIHRSIHEQHSESSCMCQWHCCCVKLHHVAQFPISMTNDCTTDPTHILCKYDAVAVILGCSDCRCPHVYRSPHAYSIALSAARHDSPRLFLDSLGVDTRSEASRSTPWPAMPPAAASTPPPPPPTLSRAVPANTAADDDDEQSTIVRSITGIVVMLAAAGLLLQLLWTGAPLPADPAGAPPPPTAAPVDDAAGAAEGGSVGATRSLQSMQRSALRMSRRTLSWIQTVSFGSTHAAGSGHSSSSERTRATSIRSELTGSAYEDVVPGVDACGVDASGSMHALSAQDIITVGGHVTTCVSANRASPGWGSSAVRSRHAGRVTAEGGAGPQLSPELSSPGSGHGRGAEGAAGSRHRVGTVSPQPSQRVQPLQRPRSYDDLPRGSGGGGPRLVRRTHKALEKCNIQGCPYRPRSVVAALLRPTAEFHYCYRCDLPLIDTLNGSAVWRCMRSCANTLVCA